MVSASGLIPGSSLEFLPCLPTVMDYKVLVKTMSSPGEVLVSVLPQQ